MWLVQHRVHCVSHLVLSMAGLFSSLCCSLLSLYSYREVFKAKHRQTGKKVALKKVLMENEKEGVSMEVWVGCVWEGLDWGFIILGWQRCIFTQFFNSIYCYDLPDLELIKMWTASQPHGL